MNRLGPGGKRRPARRFRRWPRRPDAVVDERRELLGRRVEAAYDDDAARSGHGRERARRRDGEARVLLEHRAPAVRGVHRRGDGEQRVDERRRGVHGRERVHQLRVRTQPQPLRGRAGKGRRRPLGRGSARARERRLRGGTRRRTRPRRPAVGGRAPGPTVQLTPTTRCCQLNSALGNKRRGRDGSLRRGRSRPRRRATPARRLQRAGHHHRYTRASAPRRVPARREGRDPRVVEADPVRRRGVGSSNAVGPPFQPPSRTWGSPQAQPAPARSPGEARVRGGDEHGTPRAARRRAAPGRAAKPVRREARRRSS